MKVGGSITGEHGIGMEKVEIMGKQFREETLAMMRSVKSSFDPHGLFNPGKMLPTGRGCVEIRQKPLTGANTL